MTYPNGRVPLDLFIEVGSGVDENGPWRWLATPKLWALIRAAQDYARRKWGSSFTISQGYNLYRPYDWQVVAKNNAIAAGRPGDAAAPGTSSHGGVFNGRDCLAADLNRLGLQWWQVWEACESVGLVTRYFDWEPWHVILYDPFGAVPPQFAGFLAGTSAQPFTPQQSQENDVILIRRQANNAAYVVYPAKGIKHIPSENEEKLLRYVIPGDQDQFSGLNEEDLSVVMWALGFPELEGNRDRLPLNGGYYWAPARA